MKYLEKGLSDFRGFSSLLTESEAGLFLCGRASGRLPWVVEKNSWLFPLFEEEFGCESESFEGRELSE